jgi:hypothetical protein
MVDQALLNDLLSYDPLTGKVHWKYRDQRHFKSQWAYLVWNQLYAGEEITYKNPNGYFVTSIMGKKYLLHRLIWLLNYGKWPDSVDHINGVRDDNRLANLRSVSHQDNMRNTRKVSANKSGYTGVYQHTQSNKWVAQISVGNKTKYLGSFNTKEEALTCRKKAEEMYNFHDNHGQVAGVGV